MINGQLGQWIDEAAQHWQHALAAATVIREALPMQELIRITVIAIVTALLTAQITIARLDERITAIRNERQILVEKRNEQVAEVKRDIERLETAVNGLQVQIAGIKK